MLNKIIYFSLHNRLLVIVAAMLLVIGGMYTVQHTEVDVFPDLNAPTVVVMTEAGGMAAEEIEQLVTFPIETAMNGATNVRRVRSSSTLGFSVVWVEFEWDTDIYLARQIVSEKLATIGESLPQNVGQPTLGPQSSILGELLIVGLTADSTSLLDLRTLADWTVRPRLLSTGGVAQVAVLGGDIKEYQILVSPQRMRHFGVSLAEVMAVTRGMNTNTNGGVLYQYGNEYIVRGILSTHDIDAMARTVVKTVDGAPITLSDVAAVRIGAQEPRLGVASERGKPAVLLTVTKQPATGTIELTERLEEALADVQRNLPADVHISTDIFRQSRFIESAIDNVKKSLLEGALFVVLVLALFLANVRTTFISVITLPIALLVAIITLHLLGQTINTMSLGGLAIAIGSLVDDAIVDVENVWRKLRSGKGTLLDIIYDASREVRMPILNSTLIIVVSFTPLFFLSGMEGRMLIPLGIAFIVALFASTVVALTLTPVLCSYLLRPTQADSTQPSQKGRGGVAARLSTLYLRLLQWVLVHKRPVVIGTAVAFVAALVACGTLGRSFLPPFNEGSLTINVSLLPGISLDESDRIGRQAEQLLLSVPEIQTVARKTGRAELDEHALGVNTSEIEAPYELHDRSHQAFVSDVRRKLSTIQGANIEIGQPISHRIDAMLSGTQANIAIKLFGDDLNRMYSLANRIKTAISDVEGVADLNVEQQVERPELNIVPNRELLLRYGISLPEFSEFVAVNMAGEVVSEVNEGGKRFQLIVRSDESSRSTIDAVRNLVIDAADGSKIPITNVATVESTMGPNTINRENVKRKIVISANTSGRDLHSVVDDIRERIDADITLPEGYHLEYGGQFESEQAASRILLLTSLLSIIVIYLLLYMEFHSAKESAVILLNLPLALIGGVFALCLTTGEFSIPAIIGFISLFGITTRNGMLLISQYNHLRQTEGLSVRQSILRGSCDRLNPILMTALTSAFALIPLALGGDLPGNEIQSPMAKVILGGLLTSTFLNVFIIPIVYEWINKGKTDSTLAIQNPTPALAHGGGGAKVTLSVLLGVMMVLPLGAQERAKSVTGLLQEIASNNLQLKALGEEHRAVQMERKAENTLGETSVEYSPFFTSGVDGIATSELIVSQEADFPTVYAARRRAAERQATANELAYLTLRRDILLQAKELCIDYISTTRTATYLSRRMAAADSLQQMMQRRQLQGDATLLDINRIRIDCMDVQTALADNEAQRKATLAALQALNGGIPVEGVVADASLNDIAQLPLPDERLEVRAAKAEQQVAEQEVKVQKQGMLPRLTMGYRRNTEMGESLHGVLVGGALPLFSNGKRLQAARHRSTSAMLQAEEAQKQAEAEVKAQVQEVESLHRALAAYDEALLLQTLDLLGRAVQLGELSITTYYTEADAIYRKLQDRLDVETRYQKALARLQQDAL